MGSNITSDETGPLSSQQLDEIPESQDFWIFGYGSLIWKPPPHYDIRVPGYVEGYVRRFWQVSSWD
jgi:glutathione-specific gamma-glutamylcyclotransferase